MVVAAYYGFTEITGIEFAKELCEEAESNMKKIQTIFPAIGWKVINADVLNYNIMPGDSVFFLFNPFVEETLDSFLVHLKIAVDYFHEKHGLCMQAHCMQQLCKSGDTISFSNNH